MTFQYVFFFSEEVMLSVYIVTFSQLLNMSATEGEISYANTAVKF